MDWHPQTATINIGLTHGAIAQLGERVVRNDEVRSSILLGSTKITYRGIPDITESPETSGVFLLPNALMVPGTYLVYRQAWRYDWRYAVP